MYMLNDLPGVEDIQSYPLKASQKSMKVQNYGAQDGIILQQQGQW
jgi:hypothetical protein